MIFFNQNKHQDFNPIILTFLYKIFIKQQKRDPYEDLFNNISKSRFFTTIQEAVLLVSANHFELFPTLFPEKWYSNHELKHDAFFQ